MTELVISDVDGVITDSKINIGEAGELFKSFNVKDGHAIAEWGNQRQFVIVTARESAAVTNRAAELGVDDVYQGVDDKAAKVTEIADDYDIPLEDVAYIGDDISDIGAMDIVGTAACPADGWESVQEVCDYVSDYNGGNGAVRDILNRLQEQPKTVLGVIPARYGSTRFPGKPLADIAGKPMVQHVYERASQASQIDKVVVATDDDRIKQVIENIDGQAIMTDSDHSTGTDRVTEVATMLGPDYVLNIQGDEPLVDPNLLDSMVEALTSGSAGVVTPITTVDDEQDLSDENIVKVVTDANGKAMYFSRSQIPANGSPDDTYKHIGLYGFETSTLLDYVDLDSNLEQSEDLEQLRLLEHGYDIQTLSTDYTSKEVNIERDISDVENIIKSEYADRNK